MNLDLRISQAQSGDRQALDGLLRDHVDVIHSACRRVLGNVEDANDATQNALINISRGICRYDGASAFSTWVYRIGMNAAIDIQRHRSRRGTLPLDLDPPVSHDPYSMVDERDRVDRLLQALPEDQRVALTLREVHELDYSQIAAVLEVPIGTVRSRISRARATLMELESHSDRPIDGEMT